MYCARAFLNTTVAILTWRLAVILCLVKWSDQRGVILPIFSHEKTWNFSNLITKYLPVYQIGLLYIILLMRSLCNFLSSTDLEFSPASFHELNYEINCRTGGCLRYLNVYTWSKYGLDNLILSKASYIMLTWIFEEWLKQHNNDKTLIHHKTYIWWT